MQVYADNAATTQMSNAASETMLHFLCSSYGNASSAHRLGREAAVALEAARRAVAACVGARPHEVYFTSGGTEADNWAVCTLAAKGAVAGKRHIITSRFEHQAILRPLHRLGQQGFVITLLDIPGDGIIRPDTVAAALRKDTAFVSIMAANNEIGTLQPIAEIGALCQECGVPFHTDAVQAVGHVPINMASQVVDMLSLSAHKFHGPKGVGALCCREAVGLSPLLLGGGQEQRQRAGTENVPAIAAMAAALDECCSQMKENAQRVSLMRDTIIKAISTIPGARLTGQANQRLPGVAHFCFEGIHAESLVAALDIEGICASSSSACTTGLAEPSHVLQALGVPDALANGALRLSLGSFNTSQEASYIIKMLPAVISRLRA